MFHRKPFYVSDLVSASEVNTGDYVFICTNTAGTDVEFLYPGMFVHTIERTWVDGPNKVGPIKFHFWNDFTGNAGVVGVEPMSMVSRNQVTSRIATFFRWLRSR